MRNRNFTNPSTEPFWRALEENQISWVKYFDMLVEIAISLFEWKNLPEGVDARFIELGLFRDGKMVFFRDDDLEQFLCLRTTTGGMFDFNDIPRERRAYATNGYNMELDPANSVLIYNNLLHTNSVLAIQDYAKRLAELERIMDTNAKAQKTPIIILTDEKERLTLQNVYKKYDGNCPVIYGDKGFNPQQLTVLKTDAPFYVDKLYDIKTKIWNEALTYLGVPNVGIEKRERLITDEVNRGQGGVIANRYSRLTARRQACEQIKKMFGLNVSVDIREEFDTDIEGIERKEEQKEEEAENV